MNDTRPRGGRRTDVGTRGTRGPHARARSHVYHRLRAVVTRSIADSPHHGRRPVPPPPTPSHAPAKPGAKDGRTAASTRRPSRRSIEIRKNKQEEPTANSFPAASDHFTRTRREPRDVLCGTSCSRGRGRRETGPSPP